MRKALEGPGPDAGGMHTNREIEDITPLQQRNPATVSAPVQNTPAPAVTSSSGSSGGGHKRKAEGKLNDQRAANLAEADVFFKELSLVGNHILQR